MRMPMILLLFSALAACSHGSRETSSVDTNAATREKIVVEDRVSPVDESPGELLKGHSGLRYDCAQDSDCAIMDIGNCCGHYPACVHRESTPDPAGVASECARKDLAGICGYPTISACECRAARCEGVNEPVVEDAER